MHQLAVGINVCVRQTCSPSMEAVILKATGVVANTAAAWLCCRFAAAALACCRDIPLCHQSRAAMGQSACAVGGTWLGEGELGVCGALAHRASRPDLLLPAVLRPQSDNQLMLSGERGWGRVSWGSVVPWGTAPHGPTCCFRWQVRLCYQTSAPIGQSPYPTHFVIHKKTKKAKLFSRGAGRTRMTLWQQHVRDSDTLPHHCRRHGCIEQKVCLCSKRMTHEGFWGASESLNPRVSLRGVWRARTLNIMLGPHRGCLGTGGWCQVR